MAEDDLNEMDLAETIMNDSVRELRELHRSSRPADILRARHLALLDECLRRDLIPLSRAIDYLRDNPPPHLAQGDESSTADEERRAYEDAVPFDVGSDEWCFVVLILHKPLRSGRIYGDYDGGEGSLLLADQGPRDALVENGIVCGRCLKVSPKNRCSRCKTLKYCSGECHAAHWELHKKQCRAGRLKPSDEDERRDRKTDVACYSPERMFVRTHPYPKFDDICRFLDGAPALIYTEEIHGVFERLYERVGTNTFKVYGREFGEVLFRDYGGISAMRAASGILSSVITKYPLRGDGEEEMEQQMEAEISARRFLSSSWRGIGGWQP